LFELEDNEKFVRELEKIDVSETLRELEKFTANTKGYPSDMKVITGLALAVGVSFED